MNFHCLALFICHLFADGNFRTIHIIFKPNTFSYTLLEHIDSTCVDPIPFHLTDISRPWVWPWNENDNPNNVLQLMFLDPKTLTEDTEQVKKFFALYRSFAFSATDFIEPKTRTSIAKRLQKFSESNNLVLNFGAGNVSIYIDFDAQHPKPIFTMNKETNSLHCNLFDHTFGQYERMLSISVKNFDSDYTFDGIQERANYYLNFDPTYYISNYYNLFFNKTYINFTWLRPVNVDLKLISDQPQYYKELPRTCKLIPNDDNQIDHRNTAELYIDSNSAHYVLTSGLSRNSHIYKLYPYHSSKVIVVFVYGTDFKRERDIFLVPKSILLVTILIILFMTLCSMTLFIARRKFNLPGNNITISIMDCLIPFIGGGNLQMEHRFERWFFGIMLIGGFFIIAVFGGDLVDTVVQIHSSKVKTYEDLAATNVTNICLQYGLIWHRETFFKMLR